MKHASLTEGGMVKGFLLFAIPMLLNSIMQQMFSTVDMYFIGNYVGKNAAAAVGASGVLITCMIGLFTGLTTGAGILAARFFGSKRWKEYIEVGKTARKMSVIFGVFIMLLGWMNMKSLLILFKTPNEILDDALLYAKTYLFGLMPMLLFQTDFALMKASNEAKRPVYSLLLAGVINAILDYIFILVMEWGILGASLATVISQWIAAIFTRVMFVYYIRKKLQLSYVKVKISRKKERNFMLKMLKIGLPAGIQAVFLTFSNLIMQYFVNQLGIYQVAAFAAYFKIETMIYLPILAIGNTVLIFVSQNIGAKQYERIKKGVIFSLCFAVFTTLVLSFGTLLIGEEIFWILIKDKNIIAFGKTLIFICFPFYFVYAILDITGNTVRGLGNSLIPMINSIVSLGFLRIAIVSLWAANYKQLNKIAMVYPITWGICAMLNATFLITQWRRIKRKLEI